MESQFRLIMIKESIHALAIRMDNFDGGFSLYVLANSNQLMPHFMLINE